jgi:hypothetical protein
MSEQTEIFLQLKQHMAKYSPPLIAKVDEPAHYELWSIKPVEIAGRKRSEVYFGGLIIQKAYLGFYFMPVYTHEDHKSVFHPGLLRLLKGKSCFHIKQLDPVLSSQIEEALKIGFEIYHKNGWV